MVGRLVAMAERADAILAEAMQPGGDRRLALAAMRECRETLAAVTRLAEPGTAETANMLAEAKLLVAALGMVLPAYRDTAQALADRLELTGAEELAASVRSLLEPLSSPLRDCS
jgi:hypothetical protein